MQKNRMLFFEGDNGGGSGSAGSSGDGGAASLLGEAGSQGQQQQGEAPKFLVGEDGAFAENWTTKLPEELGDYRNGLAKFKNVADFAKSYQGLEQKLGSKAKMVAIPNADSKPEEIMAYRLALGIPETADKYVIKPESIPDGITWSDDLAKPFGEIAHKHNVPPAAMKEMIAENFRQQQMGVQVQQDAIKAHLENNRAMLKKEMGGEYEKNIKLATSACKTVGIDPNSHGFTDPNVVKVVVGLRKMISDDRFVKGGGEGGTTLSGPTRAKDIQGNKDNPLNAKYKDGDPDTIALVRRLLQEA